MVRIQLDLGPLEQWPSNKLPAFNTRLLELLPGLQGHGCCFRTAGGFVRRLEDGTWLGHVAEHVALELQTLAGSPAGRGKTRSVRGKPGVYNVMYAYEHAEVALLAGRLALQLLDSLLPDALRGVQKLDLVHAEDGDPLFRSPFDLPNAIAALRRLVRRATLGPTTGALVDAARARGIPVARLNDQSLVLLGQGKYQQRIRASISGQTSLIAVEAAGDKDLTKSLLGDAGVPVPRGEVVRTADDAVRAAARLRYPVVTKPLDGNHGRGVTVDLNDEDAVRRGFEEAARHGRRVIVEQFFRGRDYRILVVNREVVAVSERVPAHVVGDGERSIAQLAEAVNRDPRRGEGHECVMTRIRLDDHVRTLLQRRGLDVDTVPAAGETVVLRDTANLSTGGIAIDRTDEIHPENALLARRAAMAVGLDIAGIDFIVPDIRRSVRDTGGGVVEVNAAPGFRMHIAPSEGQPRDVAGPVIDMLFPPGRPTRVPILAITGTNGKSTTARMLAHIIAFRNHCVGMTSTSGVYVNGQRIMTGDATGPRSARMVLRDPMVDVAVLETARGGLLREGLGFDHADVGCVLNVQPDHLGLKGIDTIKDLAWVKSLIVETVHRRGTSVLNADDPLVMDMRRRAGGRIALFSLNGGDTMSDALRAHLDAGGMAAVREPGADGGTLVIHERGWRHALMPAREVPATLGGVAEFNIANALAAIAMARAFGIDVGAIRASLARFTTSFEQSPGRLNLQDVGDFRVLLDYAHNPAGLSALGQVIESMRPRHRAVWGMITMPGDRRDEDIRELGRLSAALFDRVVLREDPSRRGRRPGEIMDLLVEGLTQAGFDPGQVTRIRHEHDATDHCLRNAAPGDLVVLIPTDVEAVWSQVQDLAAERALAVRETAIA